MVYRFFIPTHCTNHKKYSPLYRFSTKCMNALLTNFYSKTKPSIVSISPNIPIQRFCIVIFIKLLSVHSLLIAHFNPLCSTAIAPSVFFSSTDCSIKHKNSLCFPSNFYFHLSFETQIITYYLFTHSIAEPFQLLALGYARDESHLIAAAWFVLLVCTHQTHSAIKWVAL